MSRKWLCRVLWIAVALYFVVAFNGRAYTIGREEGYAQGFDDADTQWEAVCWELLGVEP